MSSPERDHLAASAAPAPAASKRPERIPSALGWALVALLTIGVLATWAPALASGLGDNHEGRILGRHALNVANAQRDGLAASGWLSDWSPYVGDGGEQTSYGHHPPLLNLGYLATAQLLPVERDVAMRVFAYLLGAGMLPVGAAVLRRLGMGWPATLVATAVVAVTPLFWVYGRLHGNVTLVLAMVWVLVRLQERRPVGRGELATACVVVSAAIVAGYLGLATAAVLGLWLLSRRGLDRVTVTIGLCMVAAAAISLGYVVATTGAGRIGAQVQLRTTGGGFTAAAFAERIVGWLTALLPGWWRWGVVPVAVVAGLRDPRTRALTALLALVAVGYVVGLPNGSFVHDYWVFPLLLPVWFGAAAAVDAAGTWLGARRPAAVPALAGGLLAVVLTAGAWSGLAADVPARYLSGPAQAGTLVRTVPPAAGQAVAWRGPGIATPRWLSYYWQLPPGEITAAALGELPGSDRVLVRTDRLEDLTADLPGSVGTAGSYAVVTVAQLRAAPAP